MQIPLFTIGCVIIGGIFFVKLFPLLADVEATLLAKGAGVLIGVTVGTTIGFRLDGIEVDPHLLIILQLLPVFLVLVATIFVAVSRRLGIEVEDEDH